jgi:hypothetical protein
MNMAGRLCAIGSATLASCAVGRRLAAPLVLACLAGACAAGPGGDTQDGPWYNKTMMELAGGTRSSSVPPVDIPFVPAAVTSPAPPPAAVSDGLYHADGSCGGLPLGPGPDGSTAPAAGGGLRLDMSECDVVKRMGLPDKVELSAGDRGERRLVLTWWGGARPGIYRFLSGRLVGIERTREPRTGHRGV